MEGRIDISLQEFQSKVNQNRDELRKKLWMLKDFGYKIVGVSAPAKGNTLLNYCKIGPEILDFIAEVDGSSKIGKYTPGSHIKVVNENDVNWKEINYALLLAWNWAEPIKKALRKRDFRGCFIIPIPKVVIE